MINSDDIHFHWDKENFEIPCTYMRLEWVILIKFILNMVEQKFWNSMSLNVRRMIDFNVNHLQHDWRKFWNSIPLDASRITNLDNIHLLHGWREFWKSIHPDAPWMTHFYEFHLYHGWTKLWNSMRLDVRKS